MQIIVKFDPVVKPATSHVMMLELAVGGGSVPPSLSVLCSPAKPSKDLLSTYAFALCWIL